MSDRASNSPKRPSDARQEAARNFLASAITGATSMALTNPLDVLKARWQVMPAEQRAAGGSSGGGGSGSVWQTGRSIARIEGLWNGLWRHALVTNCAACTCSMGVRIGLYPVVRDTLQQVHDSIVGARGSGLGAAEGAEKNKAGSVMLVSGMLSGCLGYFLSSPIFQVKTVLQAEAGAVGRDGRYISGARKGEWPSFGGSGLRALRSLAAEGGGAGNPAGAARRLWAGAPLFVLRGATLSSTQLASYDFCKSEVKRRGWMSDGAALHVLSSVAAATVLTTCVMPLDITVTRYQAGHAGLGQRYESPLLCAADMVKREGVGVLWVGWGAMFARMAPTSALTFFMYEQIRALLGLAYLD